MTLATGFVGLGAMGRGMARNLHRAGLLARSGAARRDPPRSSPTSFGWTPPTLAELAARCDVVVLCVSADADVLEVVDALAPGLRPGSIVVDCSTVAADTAREAARRLAERGVEFLDAPVSGGVEGARDGKLAIMVGGPGSAFARARPVLEAMGRVVTHFGPSGERVGTVQQPVGVSKFVHRFLDNALLQHRRILGQTVVTVVEPKVRDHRARAFELGLAEDEGENRDEQVDAGDAEDAIDASRAQTQELLQEPS